MRRAGRCIRPVLGVIKDPLNVMHDTIREGAVGEIAQIEYISKVNATAGGATNAILVLAQNLSHAAAYNAKAKQGNRQLFILHMSPSLSYNMGIRIVYHIFTHLVNNFLEKIRKVWYDNKKEGMISPKRDETEV